MRTENADDPERFAQRYSVSANPAQLAAELEVLGSDHQANGYTTVDQADRMSTALGLKPGRILVDLGAGCGWPGLYMAASTGCSVLSIDPVAEGGATARDRVAADDLAPPSAAVQADAEAIPLRSRSVDAIVHGDVLC